MSTFKDYIALLFSCWLEFGGTSLNFAPKASAFFAGPPSRPCSSARARGSGRQSAAGSSPKKASSQFGPGCRWGPQSCLETPESWGMGSIQSRSQDIWSDTTPTSPFPLGLGCPSCAMGIKQHWVQIRGTGGEQGTLSPLESPPRPAASPGSPHQGQPIPASPRPQHLALVKEGGRDKTQEAQ